MVTEEAYRRYQERKHRPEKEGEEKKEQDIHVMLDEIAKMRGYKEKLVGKRKIHPIMQYVYFLLEKNYGFKLIKRGQEYYDRGTKEWKVADSDISPIKQYLDLVDYRKMKGYESQYRYEKLIAEKEGFKSLREKEESKVAELGMSSVEEYHEYIAKKKGFDSYKQYKEYVDGMFAIKETYIKLIPPEDFEDVFKLIKEKWEKEHEKFITFCDEFWKDSLRPFFGTTEKDRAVVFVSDLTKELDKFHASRPGSLNVYNIDGISIGLSHCLGERNVDVILSKDAKTITFRKVEI